MLSVFFVLLSLIHFSLGNNLFEDGWYDTLPTFFHGCWFYGGMTLELMQTYEIDQYQMVLFEKGEGVYLTTSKTLNTASYAEDRMIDSCKLFKNTYGMDKRCFIYYNELLSWRYYRLDTDYVNWFSDPSNSYVYNNLIMWRRNGDSTFPLSTNMLTFDFRSTMYPAQEFWLNHVENVVKAPENASYIDGIFLDRGFVNKSPEARNTDGTKVTGGTSFSLDATQFFLHYTAGKNNVTNALEDRGIPVLINPGTYYYSDLVSDYFNHGSFQAQLGYPPPTVTTDDVYSFNYYMENVSMVHLEKCCADSDSLYKVYMGTKAGKEVQCHGGMTNCNLECKTGLRAYLATFLFGIEPDAKGYFACHQYWSLNQDAGHSLDGVSAKDDYKRPAEYSMPLGKPLDRVDVNLNPVSITSPNFNTLSYRPYVNRTTGVLNAVVVWTGSKSTSTVCWVNECTPNTNTANGRRCGYSSALCDSVIQRFAAIHTATPTKSPTPQPTRAPITPTQPPNETETVGVVMGTLGGLIGTGAIVAYLYNNGYIKFATKTTSPPNGPTPATTVKPKGNPKGKTEGKPKSEPKGKPEGKPKGEPKGEPKTKDLEKQSKIEEPPKPPKSPKSPKPFPQNKPKPNSNKVLNELATEEEKMNLLFF